MKNLIYFLFSASFILFTSRLNAQYTITTIAGNGIAGYAGDGGNPDSAELNMPSGVWLSWRTGNFYIADTRNNRIRQINTSHNINTFAGNNATVSLAHSYPVIDSNALSSPLDVAVNDSEEVFISETPNNLVWRLSPEYSPWSLIAWYIGDDTAGYFGDSLYYYTNKSRVNNPAGICFNSFYGNHPGFVGSITFLADKDNHVVRFKDRFSGIIYTIAGNGTAGYSGDGGPAANAQLNAPFAITTDKIGNLYIADSGNHTVRKVDTFGVISTIAGTGVAGYSGDGDSAIHAQLNSPQGIGIDDSGNVYISDAANNRIRMVDYKTGFIRTIAGNGIAGFTGDGGPADSAEINYPRGMFVDGRNSRLYFADANNNRVRKIILPGPTYVNNIVSENELILFPNPSNGLFTVQTNEKTDLQIQVYNILGERIYQSFIHSARSTINLTDQPNGIYFVHLCSEGNNLVKKLVINK